MEQIGPYRQICENLSLGELWNFVQSNPSAKDEILASMREMQRPGDTITVEGVRDLRALELFNGPVFLSVNDRGIDLEYLSFRLRGPLHLVVEDGIGSLSRFFELARVRAHLYPSSQCSISGLGWYRNRDEFGKLILRNSILVVSSTSLFFQLPSLAFQLPEALDLARSMKSVTTLGLRFLDPEPTCDFLFFQALASNPISELRIHIPIGGRDESREFYARLLAPPISLLQTQLQRGKTSVHTLRFLPYDADATSQEEEDQEYEEPSEELSLLIVGVISDLLTSCSFPIPNEIHTIEGLNLPPVTEALKFQFPSYKGPSPKALPVLS